MFFSTCWHLDRLCAIGLSFFNLGCIVATSGLWLDETSAPGRFSTILKALLYMFLIRMYSTGFLIVPSFPSFGNFQVYNLRSGNLKKVFEITKSSDGQNSNNRSPLSFRSHQHIRQCKALLHLVQFYLSSLRWSLSLRYYFVVLTRNVNCSHNISTSWSSLFYWKGVWS